MGPIKLSIELTIPLSGTRDRGNLGQNINEIFHTESGADKPQRKRTGFDHGFEKTEDLFNVLRISTSNAQSRSAGPNGFETYFGVGS